MTYPGSTQPALFADLPPHRPVPRPLSPPQPSRLPPAASLTPFVDERTIDLFERVEDPRDPLALRDLFLARIEAELPDGRPDLAELWTRSRRRRVVSVEEILTARVTARFVKELFNAFFRDDLYGRLRSDKHVILSSGSVDETAFGLPGALRACIRHAVDRDWYGYSDSRGRGPSREAVAAFENATVQGAPYDETNICLTLGGTFAISAVADFVLHCWRPPGDDPVLCALPNYPPLVEAIARRHPVRLVPLSCDTAGGSLQPLIAALTPRTPMVLLQTVINPTSTGFAEAELERLLAAASPDTVVVLDEAHECLGSPRQRSALRAAPHVVRVVSLSKMLSTPGLKLGWLTASRDFVRDYYEYASTSYGSPASVFYLFIEVMARMERWRLEGREDAGPVELAEFEPVYGLTEATLSTAFRAYCRERTDRDDALVALRDAVVARLHGLPFDVVTPSHSINLAVHPHGALDGYRWFRTALTQVGVAVYPAVLNACLGGGWVRLTAARDPAVVLDAIDRLGTVVDH